MAEEFDSLLPADPEQADQTEPSPPSPAPASKNRESTAAEPAGGQAPTPAPAAQETRTGWAEVTGTARNVQMRSEGPGGQGAPTQVLSFRLERYDGTGNRLQPIPVEVRSVMLSGQIAEGEEVKVRGRWRGGTLIAKSALNVTTGAEVGPSRTFRIIVRVAIAVVVAIILIVVVSWLIGGDERESRLRIPPFPSGPARPTEGNGFPSTFPSDLPGFPSP